MNIKVSWCCAGSLIKLIKLSLRTLRPALRTLRRKKRWPKRRPAQRPYPPTISTPRPYPPRRNIGGSAPGRGDISTDSRHPAACASRAVTPICITAGSVKAARAASASARHSARPGGQAAPDRRSDEQIVGGTGQQHDAPGRQAVRRQQQKVQRDPPRRRGNTVWGRAPPHLEPVPSGSPRASGQCREAAARQRESRPRGAASAAPHARRRLPRRWVRHSAGCRAKDARRQLYPVKSICVPDIGLPMFRMSQDGTGFRPKFEPGQGVNTSRSPPLAKSVHMSYNFRASGDSPRREERLQPVMKDPFGRAITYLRVSVTDRCDLRCVYCMSEDMTFLPKRELLTLEELDRLCARVHPAGHDQDPHHRRGALVRRDVMRLFGALGHRLGHGLKELTVTTNGSQLVKHAETLAAAGVRRVNVSLDTLDPPRFTRSPDGARSSRRWTASSPPRPPGWR